MSEVNHRKSSGVAQSFGVWGELEEGATLSCCHCQHTWILKKGSGKLRGFCQNCLGYVCGPGCMECVPVERMIENMEAGRDPKTPPPVKIFTGE